MKIIIFAGGTGKRFWPVSRKNSPKQFLPVTGDKPLLRLRYELLTSGFKSEDIFISTGVQYKNEVKAMLPELPAENFILEPEMRDTGPAVMLAVTYVNNLFPGETISVQWSDHLIKKPKAFIESLKIAEHEVVENNKIVFITVPARFPSPHRGYIKFGNVIKKENDDLELREFEKFVEKPTVEIAEHYIQSKSYGWNPGYWVFSAENYLEIVKRYSSDYVEITNEIVQAGLSSEAANKFSMLERISADYQFAEKVNPEQALTLLVDMGWSDVGEWIALKEALEESDEANVIQGNVEDMGSKKSIIYNYDDSKLVATIGLEGFVVVNTKDVVAIFKKEDNQKLKEFLKKLEEDGKVEYL